MFVWVPTRLVGALFPSVMPVKVSELRAQIRSGARLAGVVCSIFFLLSLYNIIAQKEVRGRAGRSGRSGRGAVERGGERGRPSLRAREGGEGWAGWAGEGAGCVVFARKFGRNVVIYCFIIYARAVM